MTENGNSTERVRAAAPPDVLPSNGSVTPLAAHITNHAEIVPWLCGLLQSGDSFYPTGSYAHSFGLEGLIQAGVVRDRPTLRHFILTAVVPALGRSELPIVAHTWRALADENWSLVGQLSVLASATKPAQELRTASESIGRQRAELLASLHPGSIAREYLDRATEHEWPFAATISAAVEARTLGAPLCAALSVHFYTAIASQLAAAMKLLRLGQNGAQTLLTEGLTRAPALVAAAERVPLDEIGWFNPWLDIAAARHEVADARMFMS